MTFIKFLKVLSIMFAGFMIGNLIIGDPKIISYNAFIQPYGIDWIMTIAYNIVASLIPIGLVIRIEDSMKAKRIKEENKLINAIGK
jgi:hypothetical protein